MARTATPWFRAERNGWYVVKDGHQHFLGEHPEGAPPPRKLKGRWNAPRPILQAFHALMAKPAEAAPKVAASGVLTVAELFDKFLDWCQQHRAKRTYEDHREKVQQFLNESPGVADMAATTLRPFHVIEWLGKHPTWGDTFRRNAIVSVQRPYSWAAELGYIDASPVARMKKPKAGRREQAVTPEQWADVRGRYAPDDPFRDLLEFCWETGCRPQEARQIEARHLRLDRLCVLIPPDEAKGKKRWRVIRLTARASEILGRRTPGQAEGAVFRNGDGTPWTAYAVNCRFCRLQVRIGKEKMREMGVRPDPEEVARLAAKLPKVRTVSGRPVEKTEADLRAEAKRKLTAKLARKLAVKHFAYSWRHGFATRKLLEGNDHLTVAELLGHADGSMLAKVYQHLGRHDDHLRKALNGTTPSGA